jgi:hypothetical protein
MQQPPLDVVCASDEAPSTSYTIVRVLARFLEQNRPKNVHKNRNSPEERGCLSSRDGDGSKQRTSHRSR